MTSTDRRPDRHTHGAGARLPARARAILTNGLEELLARTRGLGFRHLHSEEYPLPLAQMVYAALPPPRRVQEDVRRRLRDDPVSVLEPALVLLEIYESNQPDIDSHILEDMPFIRTCFRSKRRNGWLAVLGDGDREELVRAVNGRWQFDVFAGPWRETGIYVLLNMLARYAFVYGRIPAGDAHALSHFVEDYTPGVIVCRGHLTDLELTLSLAAMKMGVPAVVPSDYPFPLGRTAHADRLPDIVNAVAVFPNIRRLLDMPAVPRLPDYCEEANRGQTFAPAVTWGETAESFYHVRKGRVPVAGVQISGAPGPAVGILVTIEGEPLDEFDTGYIERTALTALPTVKGIQAERTENGFAIRFAESVTPDPARIGEVLFAAIRREFPKLDRINVKLLFDPDELRLLAPEIRRWKDRRAAEIAAATEETVATFCACVGCSPFAPDHVCILTPERPPQCGRPYEMIKTGALYGYDDMTNIHHRALHRTLNSFHVIAPGKCLDPDRGEWAGVNAAVRRLSGGRTRRVLLHSLDTAPHTGCGCFRLILFKTRKPRPGIGIMDSGFSGEAPDGRDWKDLHYALAGKQTPGIAGATYSYLHSRKFLRPHGGWSRIVWVSQKIAEVMGDKLPAGVEVGREPKG